MPAKVIKKTKVYDGQKAHIVAVNMGYGHQRAAYPLRHLSPIGTYINANDYKGIPLKDKKLWENSRFFYEFISRFKKIPIVGSLAFKIFDKFQEIPKFYPKKDWSKISFVRRLSSRFPLVVTKMGEDLIKKLEKNPLPLITTFPLVAFMAEEYAYSGEIYCLVTDTDISRPWVSVHPAKSRIKYFAPTLRVQERLKQYGVKSENIILTGFPLPKRMVGEDLSILQGDVAKRLCNLDPNRKYIGKYVDTIRKNLGGVSCPVKIKRLLTLMFAVGGAGAQRDIGIEIVESLSRELRQERIRVILVAGIHNDVANFFKHEIKNLGLGRLIDKNIKIIYDETKEGYFKKFEDALRTVDILWTKPSELAFYTALGFPIIMSPPIGSQEEFNRKWLTTIGSGIDQEDPRHTDQWLFDLLNSGWLAEAAMQGYMEAPRQGTYNIVKVINHKKEEVKVLKTIMQY